MAKNTFQKHGIEHLSPSTINLWISQPALCLLKLANINDGEAGQAAWRGIGAERGICKKAFEPETSTEECINIAEKEFDEQYKKALDEHDSVKVEKERTTVKDYVAVGAKFYGDMEERPESEQHRVVVSLKEFSIPTIGYYDLRYKNEIRDIKTSRTAPYKLSNAHARQTSIYAYATGLDAWVDYVTRKEVRSFKVPNINQYINQYINAAKSLEKVLATSDDIFECCQMVFPDVDHWLWGDITRSAANDIWKLKEK